MIFRRNMPVPVSAGFASDRKLRSHFTKVSGAAGRTADGGRNVMRGLLLVTGLLALAMGLLWIGQGTGAIAWPRQSFMINQLQWAGYGALVGALGLILIWQSQR